MFNLKNVAMTAAGVCLAATASIASAVPIIGELHFGSTNATAVTYDGATFGAAHTGDFTTAQALKFTNVNYSAWGDLDVAGGFDTADFLVYNPLFSTSPEAYLWQIGTFQFVLDELFVTKLDANELTLEGTGLVFDTAAGSDYTATEFSWLFTGNSGNYAFSFSSQSNPVPESSTLALLGLGLLGLGLSRARKAA